MQLNIGKLNLSENVNNLITLFVFILLPFLLILLGIVYPVKNATYFVILISWFCIGVIFYHALKS